MHVEAQARRSGNARRLMLRAAVVAGVVGAALVAPRISIHALPAPPVASSLVLSFQDAAPKRGRRPRSRRRRPSPGFPGKAARRGEPGCGPARTARSGHRGPSFSSTPTTGPIREPPRQRGAAASEPVYVGKANWLQYRVEAEPGRVKAEVVETAGRQLGVLERAALVVRGIRLTDAESAGRHPPLRPSYPERNGGESCQPADPAAEYINRVRVMFVHHTPPPTAAPRPEAPR